MRTRPFLPVLPLLFLLVMTTSSGMMAAPSATSISGGRMPYSVHLTQIDEAAFYQRLNVPPKLDEEPELTSEGYVVSSQYWATVLRSHDADAPTAEADARYYPDGGWVRARQGGEDVWLALDARQRVILDRYARLGEAGELPPEPGQLELLAAASNAGDGIGVQVGGRSLTIEQTREFWRVAAGMKPSTPPGPPQPLPQPPVGGASTRWITLTLPEGRSVQYLYSAASGTMLDILGTEWYAVPARWLVPVLGPEAAPGPEFGLEASGFPEHEGRGSPLWWLLAAVAGVGGIGGAILLSRGRQSASTNPRS